MDVGAKSLRGPGHVGGVEAEEVSTEASDVGGGHGSARDGVLFCP